MGGTKMSKSDEIWQEWLGDNLLPMWIEAMDNHYKIFENSINDLNDARNQGIDSYREAIEYYESLNTLELLKGLPLPKNKSCKNIVKDFEEAVKNQIQFRKADLELVKNPSSRIKAGKAGFWLTASLELMKKSRNRFISEFKK